MQPARCLRVSNRFADGYSECDHVMTNARLDLQDPRDVDSRTLAQSRRRLAWNYTSVGQGVGSGQLDFEPLPKPVFFAPNPTHFRPRVSCNQCLFSWFNGNAGSSGTTSPPFAVGKRPQDIITEVSLALRQEN